MLQSIHDGPTRRRGPESSIHMSVDARPVKEAAAKLGFVACGITDLEPTPHHEELDQWLARGYAGSMRYLHRQAAKRRRPDQIVPGARRAVVIIDNYYTRCTRLQPPFIARYASGEDYHLVTARRLDRLADFLRQQGATIARSFVDAGPVPERELAQRAGLGWIGKNTMLLRPGTGSFFFLGTVLTDLLLAIDPAFESEHCGNCTRCLDACPTGALTEPWVLDATRCISYLTIEHRGEIPPEFQSRLEGWAFGCDICNEVCPWNQRFAEETKIPEFEPRDDLPTSDPHYFDGMSEEEFHARFGDSPLERAGLSGMRRNWRAALASAPQPRPSKGSS
jgi:epoxyqueuosine reductase